MISKSGSLVAIVVYTVLMSVALPSSASVREISTQSARLFTANMWTPVAPSQQGRCPTFVFRLDNRVGRKVRLQKADLSVYWHSDDRLQTINGFRPKDPRRKVSLLDASGTLRTTTMLNRQVVDVCAARPGKNRVTMVLRYVTVGGFVGSFKMSKTFCVAGGQEDCDRNVDVPTLDPEPQPEIEDPTVVNHDQFPTSRNPIVFLHDRTPATIQPEDCPAPSYTISPTDSLIACVDSSTFPVGSLVIIEKSIGCPADTTRVTGGTDIFREICVRNGHNTGLRWHLGFRLPQHVRSTAGGADGYIPVDAAVYSQWYLRTYALEASETIAYERVDDAGSVQYTSTLAGSAGKLPEMPNGIWRRKEPAGFKADAYASPDPDRETFPVYCGYAPTISLCSNIRTDLNSFPHVTESMYLLRDLVSGTTPVYLYGDNSIVTEVMINAGSVPADILAQSRLLLGHTFQD